VTDTFSPAYPPSIDSTEDVTLTVYEAGFGDGYSQRVEAGLNNSVETLNLSWGVIPTADADDIIDFFRDHGGAESFYYTMPNDSVPKKYTCNNWKRAWAGPNYRTLTATFKRRYDL